MQPNSKSKGLIVGGIVPVTTLDYPEHLSAVIFCQGCCWHCPYCHNASLIDIGKQQENAPRWDSILSFLDQRIGLLDAVVFSGGEPLLQPYLKQAIKEVKAKGFKIALHTNGHNPTFLQELLPDIDWIGLDIKTLFTEYHRAVSPTKEAWETAKKYNFGEKVSQSLDIILQSGMTFEVRTTLDPRVIDKEMLELLGEELADKGVKNYALQEYRIIDASPSQPSLSAITSFFEDKELISHFRNIFPNLIIRRA